MAAHQHWRLFFPGALSNNQTYVCIASLDMRATAGGANVATGGTASASSQFAGSTGAANAFDNNSATYWESASTLAGVDRWLRYTFTSAVEIVEYVIRNGPFANEAPRTWRVQWSDDGSTWTDAALESWEPAWNASETRTYRVDNTARQFWRLNISSTDRGPYAAIATFHLRTAVGGANVATGGTGSASTEIDAVSRAVNAFDASAKTYWESADQAAVPFWLRYRLPAPQNVAEYVIQATDPYELEAPRSWTLEHSHNGVNWTVADTRSNQANWAKGEARAFTVAGAGADAAAARSFVFVAT